MSWQSRRKLWRAAEWLRVPLELRLDQESLRFSIFAILDLNTDIEISADISFQRMGSSIWNVPRENTHTTAQNYLIIKLSFQGLAYARSQRRLLRNSSNMLSDCTIHDPAAERLKSPT